MKSWYYWILRRWDRKWLAFLFSETWVLRIQRKCSTIILIFWYDFDVDTYLFYAVVSEFYYLVAVFQSCEAVSFFKCWVLREISWQLAVGNFWVLCYALDACRSTCSAHRFRLWPLCAAALSAAAWTTGLTRNMRRPDAGFSGVWPNFSQADT